MALTSKQLRELRLSPTGAAGNRVQVAIGLIGATQQDVADATAFSQPYISDVARGRHKTVTVESAHRLTAYFGCTVEDLFPAREAVAS